MRSVSAKRLKSFFIFDLPVNYSYIYFHFRQTHEGQRCVYTNWPTVATRCRLINEYWSNALSHYALLIVSSCIVSLLWAGQLDSKYFFAVVTLGIAVYPLMHVLIYRPIFTGDFLPKLETIIAAYEGRERAWLEKCKQDQLTNRALVFFLYAFDKASNANYLTATDKCADLLHKIFGSSPDGIKKALELVHKSDKRAKLEYRHRVEVSKSFDEAYTILEEMRFEEGIRWLKHLEQKFQRP